MQLLHNTRERHTDPALPPPRWASVDSKPCHEADEHKALRGSSVAFHRTVKADLAAGGMGQGPSDSIRTKEVEELYTRQ